MHPWGNFRCAKPAHAAVLRNVALWAEPTSRRTGHIPGAPVVFSSPVGQKVAGLATKVASTATKVARPATFGETGCEFSC